MINRIILLVIYVLSFGFIEVGYGSDILQSPSVVGAKPSVPLSNSNADNLDQRNAPLSSALLGVDPSRPEALLQARNLYKFDPPSPMFKYLDPYRYHFWMQTGINYNSFLPNPSGVAVRVGYQHMLIGIDASYELSRIKFGNFFALQDASVATGQGAPQPNSINPNVSTSSVWSITQCSVGIRILGHIMPIEFPLLSQLARVSGTYARFFDPDNNVTYDGPIMSFEAGLQYRLGVASPFAINGTFSYTFGVVGNAANAEWPVNVALLGLSTSLVFGF